MKPHEFISRVIDLFDFETVGWPRPTSFNSAALAIAIFSELHTMEKVVNGYAISLESKKCLGHVIIVARTVYQNFNFGASLCFTLRNKDFDHLGLNFEDTDHFYECWQLPVEDNDCTDHIDKVMDVLTFLTLKTNHRIRSKV